MGLLTKVTTTKQPLCPPPVWLMRQAGRYLPEYRRLRQRCPDFIKFCTTPSIACEATLQPLRRYPLDAAIVFADILLIPAALGMKVVFESGVGPKLSPVIPDFDLTAALKKASQPIENQPLLAPVCETLSSVSARLDRKVDLIGFCGAPFTLAAYMIHGGAIGDGRLLRQFVVTNRPYFLQLLDMLAVFSAHYFAAQIKPVLTS